MQTLLLTLSSYFEPHRYASFIEVSLTEYSLCAERISKCAPMVSYPSPSEDNTFHTCGSYGTQQREIAKVSQFMNQLTLEIIQKGTI